MSRGAARRPSPDALCRAPPTFRFILYVRVFYNTGVGIQEAGCPLNWHTVSLDPTGAVSCTCPSGRAGFRRTLRGWCQHVEALMRAALRTYRPLTLDAARLTYCPPCHGCRPLCRSLIAEWSAAL